MLTASSSFFRMSPVLCGVGYVLLASSSTFSFPSAAANEHHDALDASRGSEQRTWRSHGEWRATRRGRRGSLRWRRRTSCSSLGRRYLSWWIMEEVDDDGDELLMCNEQGVVFSSQLQDHSSRGPWITRHSTSFCGSVCDWSLFLSIDRAGCAMNWYVAQLCRYGSKGYCDVSGADTMLATSAVIL